MVEVAHFKKFIDFTPQAGVPDMDIVFRKLAHLADKEDNLAEELCGRIEFYVYNYTTREYNEEPVKKDDKLINLTKLKAVVNDI